MVIQMYEFKGLGTKKRQIKYSFLAILVLFEILIFVLISDYFSLAFIAGEVIMILLLVSVYCIAARHLKSIGDLNEDAYIIRIADKGIYLKSLNKEVSIPWKDIESIKLWRTVIYFRFKDFTKYAKSYDLNEKQVEIMQKKGGYWVGNELPHMPKEEWKQFRDLVKKYKRKFGIG